MTGHSRRQRIISKEEVVRAARMYHTNADAAAALGIRSDSLSRLCQRHGVETPSARTRRLRGVGLKHRRPSKTATLMGTQPITTKEAQCPT